MFTKLDSLFYLIYITILSQVCICFWIASKLIIRNFNLICSTKILSHCIIYKSTPCSLLVFTFTQLALPVC